jgi:hypothetical protein
MQKFVLTMTHAGPACRDRHAAQAQGTTIEELA